MSKQRIAAAPAVAAQTRLAVSIVLPCLNEAETLETCIRKAHAALEGMDGEIVIADNGSTDESVAIARRHGARVVHVERRGYGSALIAGIEAAACNNVVMLDADDSYDFGDVPAFVAKLDEGYDLVVGNRFLGGIKTGAMPFLHRYLGNPVLTAIGRLFFDAPCGDFHCGMRAFRKATIQKLDLRSTGMEFASEMIVKAALLRLRIAEIPTTLSPDGRSRRPHLRTWHDGWRHLRFLLLYSPRWLFLYPGVALLLFGFALGTWLLPGPRFVGSVGFDVNTLLVAALSTLVGYQAIAFATFTKVFGISEGFLPSDSRLDAVFRIVNLEFGLLLGAILVVGGLCGWMVAVRGWADLHFGQLNPAHTFRIVIPSSTAVALGVETILSSFFLSVLGLKRK